MLCNLLFILHSTIYYGILNFRTKFLAKTTRRCICGPAISSASKEYSWCPEGLADQDEKDAADPSVKPGHQLLLKSAKVGEVSVLQVESESYSISKVYRIGGRRIQSNYQFITPIIAMRGEEDHHVDIPIRHHQADPNSGQHCGKCGNFYSR